jgi:hypothetical protein
LDGIIEYMEEDEANVDEIRVDLEDIIDMLAEALDERLARGGRRRRGRTTRKKSLRQRK